MVYKRDAREISVLFVERLTGMCLLLRMVPWRSRRSVKGILCLAPPPLCVDEEGTGGRGFGSHSLYSLIPPDGWYVC